MSTSAPADHKPWYKQFWLLFVLGFPFASIILGLSLLTVSIITRDDLVTSGYYEEGISINQLLDKIQTAKALQISAHITIADDSKILLTLDGDTRQWPAELLINFGHWRFKEQDLQLRLHRGKDQRYHADLPYMQHGKWYIDAYPAVDDPDWLIKTSAFFPSNDITLSP